MLSLRDQNYRSFGAGSWYALLNSSNSGVIEVEKYLLPLTLAQRSVAHPCSDLAFIMVLLHSDTTKVGFEPTSTRFTGLLKQYQTFINLLRGVLESTFYPRSVGIEPTLSSRYCSHALAISLRLMLGGLELNQSVKSDVFFCHLVNFRPVQTISHLRQDLYPHTRPLQRLSRTCTMPAAYATSVCYPLPLCL